ncbi:MAG: nucleoside recognition domain-containing protein [Bacillota bacterium]
MKTGEQPQQAFEQIRDRIVANIYLRAEEIARRTVHQEKDRGLWDKKLDDICTSPFWGYLIMLGLLGAVFWLTVAGANYPSQLLANLLFGLEKKLLFFFAYLQAPQWLTGILVLGMYRTLAWVVSVMLPPMAIFFPLFTLLEDLGYLPRVAFNLDYLFKKCGTHGKQALTMCMGFGCNAAGVISCRIIDSPRERLIAILTNNFVPCNGRFPTLILMASLFLSGGALLSQGLLVALAVLGGVLIGIAATLLVSFALSKTILRGIPSTFTLELPPFRKPQIGRVIIRSLLDRTIFVLARAMSVAAPAGLVIWVIANAHWGGVPLIKIISAFLDPLARAIGLDGIILLAFILGIPANEIVIPLAVMGYLSTGSMLELDSLQGMKNLLVVENGWTWLTAANVVLFSLLHYPCSTTLITIFKETGSGKWTLLAFLLPTLLAVTVCFLFTQTVLFLRV